MRNTKLRGNTLPFRARVPTLVPRAFPSCFYLLDGEHFCAVCSVIDTRYDVIITMWGEQKCGPRAAKVSGSLLSVLPHYKVHHVSQYLSRQRQMLSFCFIYNKKKCNVRKDFSTPFDVIMIYTKRSTPLQGRSQNSQRGGGSPTDTNNCDRFDAPIALNTREV